MTLQREVDRTGLDDVQERQRRDALQRYGIAARPLGPDFDDLVAAAAAMCAVPTAAINVVDERRQVTMAAVGGEPGPNLLRSESWCTEVITSGEEVYVPDVRDEPVLRRSASHTEHGLTFYLGVPLRVPEGVTVGSLCVADVEPRRLRPDQLRGFASLGRVATALLEGRRNLLALAEVSAQFEQAAATDPLTDLPNRRGVSPLLAAVPPGTSVVMIDLDHFKALNDQRGHAAGDGVLVEFADLLRTGSRRSDHAARWGGEEFLLVLPDTEAARAAVVVEHLRQRWALVGPVTFSAGIACTREWESVERVLDRADSALYSAKDSGRDRTVTALR